MDMEWKAAVMVVGEVKWGMMALLILSLPVLHSNYRSVTALGMQSIDCGLGYKTGCGAYGLVNFID